MSISRRVPSGAKFAEGARKVILRGEACGGGGEALPQSTRYDLDFVFFIFEINLREPNLFFCPNRATLAREYKFKEDNLEKSGAQGRDSLFFFFFGNFFYIILSPPQLFLFNFFLDKGYNYNI